MLANVGEMIEQPFMTDVVEAAFDVGLENPQGVAVFGECFETLFHCVPSASFPPETVGIPVGGCFGNGVQCHQVEYLHDAVFHCGDA